MTASLQSTRLYYGRLMLLQIQYSVRLRATSRTYGYGCTTYVPNVLLYSFTVIYTSNLRVYLRSTNVTSHYVKVRAAALFSPSAP